MLAKPINKKSPFTVELLQAIVEDARKINTLTSIRLAVACLLSFAAFLRCDELVNIRLCDLVKGDSYLPIHIPHSKNDQMRQGREVLIGHKETRTHIGGVHSEKLDAWQVQGVSKEENEGALLSLH